MFGVYIDLVCPVINIDGGLISIVTEEEDRKQEEEHIRTALHTCGYPDWVIKKVKEQMNRKKAIRKDKYEKDKAQEKSRGVVTVPYVHSFTEKIQRIFAKHRVATVVKPQTTLRQVSSGFSSPEGQS